MGSRGARSNEANGEDRSQNESTLLNQAKTAAGDVYEAVADKAATKIDEQKAGLTGKLTGVADTVRRVSGTLHDTEAESRVSEYAARYTDTAAEKIESVAQYFNSADMKDIARDLESYARRNPAVFLGGAFAIGIMAARFLKSSPPADAATTAASRSTTSQPALGGSPRVQAASATSRGV
ncbi:hypothetical protein BH20ACI2_BH20ACI2_18420 [soil metagenome]